MLKLYILKLRKGNWIRRGSFVANQVSISLALCPDVQFEVVLFFNMFGCAKEQLQWLFAVLKTYLGLTSWRFVPYHCKRNGRKNNPTTFSLCSLPRIQLTLLVLLWWFVKLQIAGFIAWRVPPKCSSFYAGMWMQRWPLIGAWFFGKNQQTSVQFFVQRVPFQLQNMAVYGHICSGASDNLKASLYVQQSHLQCEHTHWSFQWKSYILHTLRWSTLVRVLGKLDFEEIVHYLFTTQDRYHQMWRSH